MKAYRLILPAAAVLAVSACATAPGAPQSEPRLVGTTWQLLQINYGRGNTVNLSPPQQASHTVTFNADGTVSMMLDCNRGNGDWSAQSAVQGNGELRISQIAATRALCPSPSHGEAMAADLPTASSYSILPDDSGLTIVTRRAIYVFVAAGSAGGDALVPGTDYHATAQVPCSFNGGIPTLRCPAGVKRDWGEPGRALVEITKPDGLKRGIYFDGTHAFGADSAEADGSAGWIFEATRRGDDTYISYGPERYVIPDALVVGG